MTKKAFNIIAVTLCMVFAGCQDEKQITPEQRYIADTLYSGQLSRLRLKGDSLCKLYQDSFYRQAIDSLQDVYLEELDYYFRK